MSVISLVVVKKGDNEIAGLTDATKPLRLGPKRASKIRKLFVRINCLFFFRGDLLFSSFLLSRANETKHNLMNFNVKMLSLSEQ